MRKKIFLILLLGALAFLLVHRQMRVSLWDGKSHLNLVLISDSEVVLVVSLEPEKSLNILALPDNFYLEIPHGYGRYQLGSIYPLGELENQAGKLLKETLQQSLAIPVEAYLQVSGHCSVEQLADCLLTALKAQGETDLSRWDLFRLWLKVKELRLDQINQVNLEETAILKELKLPDGTIVLETEITQMDSLVKKFFCDRRVRDAAFKIEILNATEHSRVANEVARLLNNIGGVVISVGNSENQIQNSHFAEIPQSGQLKIQNEGIKNSYTVQKLEKILETEVVIGEMPESRADILILLGEDYYHRWYQ